MTEKHSIYDVFTPTTPARLTFVERNSINNKLVNALRTPGKQVVVYGYSGSGKTTLLLNKLHQLYEFHIVSRCMKGITFDQLVLDAFDQLSPYYTEECSKKKTRELSTQISQDYLTIKNQIGTKISTETSTKETRALPPQLTAQNLARFMGEVKSCWVLEDFHKIDESERVKLSQVMKVFMDMADTYRDLKVIAIGAVDTARQVVEYDPEMSNRVAEIHVPLMDAEEIEEIISKGESIVNVSIDNNVKNGISHYSNGLASICHHLCLNMCTSVNIYETSKNNIFLDHNSLQVSLKIYLDEASDTIKKSFDKAFKQKKSIKYENGKLILWALSELPQDGANRAEIFQKIRSKERRYPQGNLTIYLENLLSEEFGSIVRLDKTSGKYSFNDPIYRVFALAYFSKEIPKKFKKSSIEEINYIIDSIKVDFSKIETVWELSSAKNIFINISSKNKTNTDER